MLCSIFLLNLAGCAVKNPYDETSDGTAQQDFIPSVLEMREALKESQLEYIQGKKEHPIPVRYFQGREGHSPVIMLHGLQSHSLWFVQSSRFIADLGIPVYAMDRRGSGLSTDIRGDADNYQEMVEDIDSVVEHVRLRHNSDKVHVLGHCFGAIPATLYASIHPDKVKSLILPTPGIHTHSDLTFSQKFQVLFFTMTGSTRYIPVPLDTELFTDSDAYRNFIDHDRLSLTHATTSMYFSIHQARRYLKEHKTNVTVPVFMGFAGQDRISDNDDNRRFFDQLSNTKNALKTYKQASHILEYSGDKDLFFSDLEEWFQNVGELN